MTTRLLAFLPTALLPKRGRVDLTNLFALWRSRRALGRLDAARQADIGLGHEACTREAARPIWDVPAHWTE